MKRFLILPSPLVKYTDPQSRPVWTKSRRASGTSGAQPQSELVQPPPPVGQGANYIDTTNSHSGRSRSYLSRVFMFITSDSLLIVFSVLSGTEGNRRHWKRLRISEDRFQQRGHARCVGSPPGGSPSHQGAARLHTFHVRVDVLPMVTWAPIYQTVTPIQCSKNEHVVRQYKTMTNKASPQIHCHSFLKLSKSGVGL